MNISEMNNRRFTCDYPENSRIKKSIVNGNTKTVTFEFADGSTVEHPFLVNNYFDEYCSAYMIQYGVNISEDGLLYFLHGWYKCGGLGCYEVDTGKLRWRIGIKHARDAFVDGAYIYCLFYEYGFAKILIETGEIVKRYPTQGGEFFKINEFFLAPVQRGYFRLINKEFETVYKIPSSEIEQCFPFVDSIVLTGEILTISYRFHTAEDKKLNKEIYQMWIESNKDDKIAKEMIAKIAAERGVPVENYFKHGGSISTPGTKTIDISPYRCGKV